MKKLNLIKEFKFNRAEYNVGDSAGTSGVLKMDYANNKFSIEFMSSVSEEQKKSLEKELILVAEDLLAREHGVNFAATGQV